MNRNFSRALSLVLKHEGGYVDHPKDPGGATNKGITIGTFRRFVKANGTKDDLKRITDAQVAEVYRKQYWDVVRGDDLPDGLDYAVFDFGVNSGPGRAARYLQGCLGVPVDGAIGPKTIAACRQHDTSDVVNSLCDDRMAFLKGLKTWPTFKKGWTARVSGVRNVALQMSNSTRVVPSAPVTKPVTPVSTPVQIPATSKSGLATLLSLIATLFKRSK